MFSTTRDDLNLKLKILQIAVLLRIQSLLKKEPKVFLLANFGGFVTEKRNCEIHVKKTFSFFSKRDWHCRRIAICSTPNQRLRGCILICRGTISLLFFSEPPNSNHLSKTEDWFLY